jgi:hypothetical protein
VSGDCYERGSADPLVAGRSIVKGIDAASGAGDVWACCLLGVPLELPRDDLAHLLVR